MARAAKPKEPSANTVLLTMPKIDPGDRKAAAAAIGAGKVGQNSLISVPVANLRTIPGFNIRVTDTEDYKEDIQTLARSMLTEGFYSTKPLSGYAGKDPNGEDTVFITDGHRRVSALTIANEMGAGIESVPVILKPAETDVVDLTVALVKENSGRPLKMAENAVVVRRLLKHGLAQAEIAERLDFTPRYVDDLLLLIGASRIVKDFVKHDKVSGTEAVRLLRLHAEKNPGKAEEIMATMVASAEARGAKRASRKDSPEGTKSGVSVATRTRIRSGAKGEERVSSPTDTSHRDLEVTSGMEFLLEEAEPFKALLDNDESWYSLVPDKEGVGLALEDISIRAIIKRAARAEPELEFDADVEGEPEVEVAVRTRKGRKAKAAAEADLDIDLEPGQDDDGEGDADDEQAIEHKDGADEDNNAPL